MKLDIIIGNPPYQENDGGGLGTSSKPLYNEFIYMATGLGAKVIFIIPARWYCGGKGLDNFRNYMLSQNKIRYIRDFPDLYSVFDSVKIPGGIMYFLWDNEYNGECIIDDSKSKTVRRLSDMDILIRDNTSYEIVHKIQEKLSYSFEDIVSERRPYGFGSDLFYRPEEYGLNHLDIMDEAFGNSVRVFGINEKNQRVQKYINRDKLGNKRNFNIDKYKVFLSKAIWDEVMKTKLTPMLGYPGDICTETYLEIGPFNTQAEADNCMKYIQSKIFHIVLLSGASSQNISRKNFRYIPIIDFSIDFNENNIALDFGINEDQFNYIQSVIKD